MYSATAISTRSCTRILTSRGRRPCAKLVIIDLLPVFRRHRVRAPRPRRVQLPFAGNIIPFPEVGGLHHCYERLGFKYSVQTAVPEHAAVGTTAFERSLRPHMSVMLTPL